MSYPPGTPDPDDQRGDQGAPDPWARPQGDQPPSQAPSQPAPQPSSQPSSQQPSPYGPPPYTEPSYGYGQPPGQQQPQYGAPGQHGGPGHYGYGAPPRTNGKATAALWTGIGSIVLSFCCGAGILGVLPIILGVQARGEIRRTGQEGDGMALAGIITGAIAVVLSLLVIALIVVAFANGETSFESGSETGGV